MRELGIRRTSRAAACVFLALPLVLLGTRTSSACLWQYGTDARGVARQYNSKGGSTVEKLIGRRKPTSEWDARKRELAAKLAGGDYTVRNDYAVALIHLGELDEALAILTKIEAEHPGQYVTAANLGTVYELLSKNEDALKWIKEGMKRNADSHLGTEWVHVKILEAKIQLAKDPDWLKTHSVLGLDFGTDLVPKSPATDADKTQFAIEYQLQERLQFVKAPDPIVGDLLHDLANLTALKGPVESAIPIYKFALSFKPVRAELIERRAAHFESLVQNNPVSGLQEHETWLWGGVIAAIAVTGVVLALILFLGIRRRRSARQVV